MKGFYFQYFLGAFQLILWSIWRGNFGSRKKLKTHFFDFSANSLKKHKFFVVVIAKEKKMGRKRKRPNEFKQDTDPQWKGRELPTTNELFIEYYRGLSIFSEEEWAAFWDACHRPLPTTFRITQTQPFHQALRLKMQNHFAKDLAGIQLDDRSPPPPSPLQWYPGIFFLFPFSISFLTLSPFLFPFSFSFSFSQLDNYGWSYSLGRNEIRKHRAATSLQGIKLSLFRFLFSFFLFLTILFGRVSLFLDCTH